MRVLTRTGMLFLALVAVACGGDEPSGPEPVRDDVPAGSGPAAETAESGADPSTPDWSVVLRFSLGSGADAAALGEVVDVVRRRLEVSDVGAYGVTALGTDGFEVGFAELASERRDEILELIMRAGTLEFLVVVRSPTQFSKAPGNEEPVSPRSPLWKGDQASYDAFLDAEIKRWTKARDAGSAYVPSRAGFRLVPSTIASDGEQLFALVEVPSPAETFDGKMLQNARIARDQGNAPVVVFDVRESWRKRFGDWTEKNKLLPVGIVFDGVLRSAPVIRERLTSTVQITLGAGSAGELLREARVLVAALEAGALPAQPELESITTK